MKKDFLFIPGIVILLAVWQILACLLDNNLIVPDLAATFKAMSALFMDRAVLIEIWRTVWKVFLALLLSILLGIPTGLLLGKSELLFRLFRPTIMVIQAVPLISWLTLIIFSWGIGWKGPVFIATLSLLPVSILTTLSGVRSIDLNLLKMALFYKVPRQKIHKEIYLRALFPFIIAILDVNIGQAWKAVLVSEYLCGGNGLGNKILMARMNVDIPGAWALTTIAVSLGIVTELLLKLLLGKMMKYGNLSQSYFPVKKL